MALPPIKTKLPAFKPTIAAPASATKSVAKPDKPIAKSSFESKSPNGANIPKPDPTMAKASKLSATMKQMAETVLAAPADKEGLDLEGQLVDFRDKLAQMEELLATPDVPIEEFKQGFQLLKRHLLDVPQLGAELDEKEIGVISGAAWTQVDQGMATAIKEKGNKKAKKTKPAKFTVANAMKQPDAKQADDLDGLLF